MGDLQHRYDFLLLFDVKEGNPNGDPDAGNLPRMDPETGHGLVTDVCLKRKVRNFVELTRGAVPGYEIFVKERGVLNRAIEETYVNGGVDLTSEKDADGKKRKDKNKAQGSEVDKGRSLMCQRYFDVRTFGAVMSTGPNAGQVRGPVQLTFARSVAPVLTLEHAITRMAVATEKEAEEQGGDNRTMGRKFTVPYGLYVAQGFISPQLAKQTGFSEDDLSLFWGALGHMFEMDRSAARGMMATRGLFVFEHESPLGNAPAHRLFERVRVAQVDSARPARDFSDYRIELAEDRLPDGVRLFDPTEAYVLS